MFSFNFFGFFCRELMPLPWQEYFLDWYVVELGDASTNSTDWMKPPFRQYQRISSLSKWHLREIIPVSG